MATLTAKEIAVYAIGAGWPVSELPTAVAVALCESGGRTDVVGGRDNCCTGLWQVHRVHGHTVAQLKNPSYNAKAARSVWDQQGWGTPGTSSGWQCYTNGAYRARMPEAITAVKGVLTRMKASGSPLAGGLDLSDLPDLPGPLDDLARDAAGNLPGLPDVPSLSDLSGAVSSLLDLDGIGRTIVVAGATLVVLAVAGGLVAMGLSRLTGVSPSKTITDVQSVVGAGATAAATM